MIKGATFLGSTIRLQGLLFILCKDLWLSFRDEMLCAFLSALWKQVFFFHFFTYFSFCVLSSCSSILSQFHENSFICDI